MQRGEPQVGLARERRRMSLWISLAMGGRHACWTLAKHGAARCVQQISFQLHEIDLIRNTISTVRSNKISHHSFQAFLHRVLIPSSS